MTTTFELYIRHDPAGRAHADARLTHAASMAPAQLATAVPLALDLTALLAHSHDPPAYGRALSAQLFAAPALRDAWLQARAVAAAGVLQLRLRLDPAASALHALRWETLRDPETDQPLALDERVRLVRTLDSADLTPVQLLPRPALRALVVVANPSDLAAYGLAEVDGEGEVSRARAALGDIPVMILGDHAAATGRATRAHLAAALRDEPAILLLVAHGTLHNDEAHLWLEHEDGAADRVAGAEFTATVARLTSRPLLVVLAACRGAGSGYGETLSALGPGLARIGVPAVLAFQGDVALSTVKAFLPPLITELRRDGQIDRALAAARAALGEAKPWWQAVLWLRTDGRLWDESQERPSGRQERLRALLHDHSGFIASRMEAFVGRAAELAEIRQRIAEKLPTGGYVTITGQAGQGKSSIIARLVDATIAEQGDEGVAYHFIPFSPGPDHQVGLLRNLLARLCLRYGLPELYAAAESRPALRDYFATALRDVAQLGEQVIIYLDGLDQIEEDVSGVRDLSFLPEEPPEGIVFVLGTRPNDTLKPLELRKPQHEYWLPALSRADFDLVLTHRGVTLDRALTDRFYTAMQENALYLDLVAKELREQGSLPPEELIKRVADNPDNLFSLTTDRLKRNRAQWRALLKPILGLLLATRAPLSARVLRALVGVEDEDIREGVQRLGGLLQRAGEGRYALFHLKLGDYLRQNPAQPGKAYIFATDEEEGYHQRLVGWCEGGTGGLAAIWQDAPGDMLEHERRTYARQHYVAHLAAAKNWARLWDVLDEGSYGKAKRHWEPSTRSYALDLDIGRQATIDAVGADSDAQARLLPRLWQYSLLRCSLNSRASNYPEELFLALVAQGRSNEAINLAELLSEPVQKANILRLIGSKLVTRERRNGINVLQRAHTTTEAISDDRRRTDVLRALANTFATAECWRDARATIDAILDDNVHAQALADLAANLATAQYWEETRTTIDAIPDNESRAQSLSNFATALAAAQHSNALATFTDARAAADAIPDTGRRSKALSNLATMLAAVQHPDALATFTDARVAADAILDDRGHSEALTNLAASLAVAQRWEEARTTADAIPHADNHGYALRVLVANLAAAQRWEEARATADAIPYNNRREEALGALDANLAAAQRWEEARTTADAILGLWSRAQALANLTTNLAIAQCWEEARATADAIPDIDDDRAKALANLAGSLAAAQYWEEARTTIDAIPYDGQRAKALNTLAANLAAVQCWEEARATIDAIPDDYYRAKALSNLAASLAAAQHSSASATFTQARAAADAIGDDIMGHRANALTNLAASLAAASHPFASSTFAQARAAADAIPYDIGRAEVLSNLAVGLASTQRWEDAYATANAIPNDDARARSFTNLAANLAVAQQPFAWTIFAHAHAVANTIPYDNYRANALTNLAASLAAAQHPSASATFAQARAAADAIRDDIMGHRAETLTNLAGSLAAAQYWEEARATIDAIPYDGQRAKALNTLAANLAAVQCWEEARATIDAIPDDYYRAKALSNLAASLAAAQHPSASATFAQARAAADAIRDDIMGHRSGSLTNLAGSLAAAQYWEEARATIDAIPYDGQRAKALNTLAANLAAAQYWTFAKSRVT